jgi:threonine dehydratase
VGVAALISGRLPDSSKTCLVVSGGNIDLNMASRVLEQGLAKSNRFLVLRCPIVDKPGRLLAILSHMAEQHVNLLDVHHYRAGWRVPLGLVEVEMLVETRNAAHAEEIIRSLETAGYEVTRSGRGG